MIRSPICPTSEQALAIKHEGPAFISACPGAGKTRVLLERARTLLPVEKHGKGIAFLSYTRAAVADFENKLRGEGILTQRIFPHFVGTFDKFTWSFLVSPFGLPDSDVSCRIIPDKGVLEVRPFASAHPLPLKCFDRSTGAIKEQEARRVGFDVVARANQVPAYETAARSIRLTMRKNGQLDFNDAREIAIGRIREGEFSKQLGVVLAARFSEIVVDEAQDCNQDDIEIVEWLRSAGIDTKVVCDPNQSIYEFRGGVTNQLLRHRETYKAEDQLSLTGNFRSSPNICKAVAMFRPKQRRGAADSALGRNKQESLPVYVLSFAGNAVSAVIGTGYCELLKEAGIDILEAPILAATKSTAANAVGQPNSKPTRKLTLRLAKATTAFHFSFELGSQIEEIEEIHKIVLSIEGKLENQSYHQFMQTSGLKAGEWRPRILELLQELKYNPNNFHTPDQWLSRARELLKPLLSSGSGSIAQKLKNSSDLGKYLKAPSATWPPPRTIHSAKGLEFPAVCVVTVSQTLKGILDYLENDTDGESAEMARELYVAASRAERLLVFAVPRKSADRVRKYLVNGGVAVVTREV